MESQKDLASFAENLKDQWSDQLASVRKGNVINELGTTPNGRMLLWQKEQNSLLTIWEMARKLPHNEILEKDLQVLSSKINDLSDHLLMETTKDLRAELKLFDTTIEKVKTHFQMVKKGEEIPEEAEPEPTPVRPTPKVTKPEPEIVKETPLPEELQAFEEECELTGKYGVGDLKAAYRGKVLTIPDDRANLAEYNRVKGLYESLMVHKGWRSPYL